MSTTTVEVIGVCDVITNDGMRSPAYWAELAAHTCGRCETARIWVEFEMSINFSATVKYTKQIAFCNNKIFSLCKHLTELRKEVAKNFCINIENELRTLNIPDGFYSKHKTAYFSTANYFIQRF